MSAHLSPTQLRELANRLEVEALRARPLAKTHSSLREAFTIKSHAAFVASIDLLIASKASWRQVAFRMDMDVHTLRDVYDGKRKLQGWMIAALPSEARREFLRVAGLWDDEQLEAVGA